MDALLEKLDSKLREWNPETAAQVRQHVEEIITMADRDDLELVCAHLAEHEDSEVMAESTAC